MIRPDRPPLRRVPGGWVAAADPARAAELAALLAQYAADVAAGLDRIPSSDRWQISDRD